jgi:hypothetical protein
MEPLDLPTLADLIHLLKTQGVGHFEGLGIRLSFSPTSEPLTSSSLSSTSDTRTPAKSIWEHPDLWPGGKPPSFPR